MKASSNHSSQVEIVPLIYNRVVIDACYTLPLRGNLGLTPQIFTLVLSLVQQTVTQVGGAEDNS